MEIDLGKVQGLSAYEIAVEKGFEGTEEEWLQSLKGDTGEQGIPGEKGDNGEITYNDVIDNLENSQTQKPLSANQGRILHELINGVNSKKIDYYLIDEEFIQDNIQSILDIKKPKIIEFQTGEYVFSQPIILNENTTLILNNATITGGSVDLIRNFKQNDEFLGYEGNSNITIIGGKIVGAGICFCHAKNIHLKNIVFEKCSGAHFIQIAGSNGVVIDNCSFDGIPNTVDNFREYVQIDNMDYTSMPLFKQDNPTYDNTINQNWYVTNCKFLNSQGNNYTMFSGIGNHSSNEIDEFLHKNIYIENCVFENTSNFSCRFISIDGLTINNCRFSTDIGKGLYSGSHIYMWHRMKNVYITNNIFIRNHKGIACEIPVYIDNININNNIFKDFNETESYMAIVRLFAPSNSSISNNSFKNCTQGAIHIGDHNNTNNINTENNYLIDNNYYYSTDTTQDIIRAYSGNPTIINNTILIPDTSSNIALQSANDLISPVIKNNNINVNKFFIPNNTDTEFIYDIPIVLWQGEQLSNDSVSLNFNILKFTKLRLTLGHINEIFSVVIQPYYGNIFHAEESFDFIGVKNGTEETKTPIVFSLTINTDNTVQFNNRNSNVPLRRIEGIN